MKKIITIVVCAFSIMLVKAQGLSDNYSKVYAGYVNLGISDVPITDNGFLIGYSYGANITENPLFIEFGAEYLFAAGGDAPLDEKIHMANIPLSIAYKIGTEEINFAPAAGFDLKFNMAYSISGESFSEAITTVQGGWHIGGNLNYKNISLGYKFSRSFNEMVKDTDQASYSHSVVIGYCF